MTAPRPRPPPKHQQAHSGPIATRSELEARQSHLHHAAQLFHQFDAELPRDIARVENGYSSLLHSSLPQLPHEPSVHEETALFWRTVINSFRSFNAVLVQDCIENTIRTQS